VYSDREITSVKLIADNLPYPCSTTNTQTTAEPTTCETENTTEENVVENQETTDIVDIEECKNVVQKYLDESNKE
jgi:hypothetical protein